MKMELISKKYHRKEEGSLRGVEHLPETSLLSDSYGS
jgi:hypothetical protein